mgnify:CR=1 FL=1
MALFKVANNFVINTLHLVSKSNIHRCNAHELHAECKHHENDQDGNNGQRLRHCIPPPNFVNFEAKEIDSNFDDAIKYANERVQQNDAKECSVHKQLYVVKSLVVR